MKMRQLFFFSSLLFTLLIGSKMLVCAQSLPPLHTTIQRYTDVLNTAYGLVSAYDGSGRKFIIEQTGAIRIIENDILLSAKLVDLKTQLMGIAASTRPQGLLGLAFHPNFKNNHKFYVYYSTVSNTIGMSHKNVIEELSLIDTDSLVKVKFNRVILAIDQPSWKNNGGALSFGKDGYLYIGTGDGGSTENVDLNSSSAQDLLSLLGKILRIDINSEGSYGIPKDNPFLNNSTIRPEIWAYGFCNPWRLSFDQKNGDLYCGDNAQENLEEINLVQKGKNYGWPIDAKAYSSDSVSKWGISLPIAGYQHTAETKIIGGFVYHGKKYKNLKGKYLYADHSGKLYYLEMKNGKWQTGNVINEGEVFTSKPYNIESIGEDEDGELYIVASEKTATHTSGAGIIFRFLEFNW